MSVTSERQDSKDAEAQASAVGSASRDVINGHTVLSVNAHISGFTVASKKSSSTRSRTGRAQCL